MPSSPEDEVRRIRAALYAILTADDTLENARKSIRGLLITIEEKLDALPSKPSE